MDPIKTTYVYPPIPQRQFDWSAVRGDYDLGALVGWGRTESEAIADLLELEQDRAESASPAGPIGESYTGPVIF